MLKLFHTTASTSALWVPFAFELQPERTALDVFSFIQRNYSSFALSVRRNFNVNLFETPHPVLITVRGCFGVLCK